MNDTSLPEEKIPEEISEWLKSEIENTHPYVYNDDAHLMKVDSERARGKKLAIAMYRYLSQKKEPVLREEDDGTENVAAGMWMKIASEYRESLELMTLDPINYTVQQRAEKLLKMYPGPSVQTPSDKAPEPVYPRWVKCFERLPTKFGVEGPIFREIDTKKVFGYAEKREDQDYIDSLVFKHSPFENRVVSQEGDPLLHYDELEWLEESPSNPIQGSSSQTDK